MAEIIPIDTKIGIIFRTIKPSKIALKGLKEVYSLKIDSTAITIDPPKAVCNCP
jgi:hypothetical protein